MSSNSNKSVHPLAAAFDIEVDGDRNFDDQRFEANFEVPTDPELTKLNDVIRLSMASFDMIMGRIENCDPRHVVKLTETAYKFLETSKDAIFKRDTLVIKEQELTLKKLQKTTPKTASGEVVPSGDGVSRSELARRAKEAKEEAKKH